MCTCVCLNDIRIYVCSVVLFLDAEVGGPTLVSIHYPTLSFIKFYILYTILYITVTRQVTDQLLEDDQLANRGWLYEGATNRLVMFDAKYLHGMRVILYPISMLSSAMLIFIVVIFIVGVIPGRGVASSASPSARRLTFMVGFWRNICAQPRGKDSPGPGQPLPDPSLTLYTWVNEVFTAPVPAPTLNTPTDTHTLSSPQDDSPTSTELKYVSPVYADRIWERVGQSSSTSSSGTGSDGSEADFPSKTPQYNECFQGF